MKRCSKCGETKPTEGFAKDKKRKDGLQCFCKSCMRLYRSMNVERAREVNKAWRADNAERLKESKRVYQSANAERIRLYERAYYKANLVKKRLQHQRYRETRGRMTKQAYRTANPDIHRTNNHRHKARKRAIEGTFSARDIEHIAAMQGGHCCYCGQVVELTVEHVIPAAREGTSNDPWNLALACGKCNSSKRDKLVEEWVDRWYMRQ